MKTGPEKLAKITKWRKANPDKVRAYARKYNQKRYKEKTEEMREYQRNWSRKNKDRIEANRKARYDPIKASEKRKARYYKDRERHLERSRLWKSKNREKLRPYSARYGREKRKSDANFRLRCALRSSLNLNLRKASTKKSERLAQLLGCPWPEFLLHLESQFLEGMSWQNRGLRGWHVDHIVPLSAFDHSNQEQVRVAWHYSNMRPMWWRENLSKGNKII